MRLQDGVDNFRVFQAVLAEVRDLVQLVQRENLNILRLVEVPLLILSCLRLSFLVLDVSGVEQLEVGLLHLLGKERNVLASS